MPTIYFESNLFGGQRRIEVEGAERLVDICDRELAPVPFSCRGATCGTCRLEVVEGLEFFEPAGDAEAELHALLDDPPSVRLACQARIRSGNGVIRLRIAGNEI